MYYNVQIQFIHTDEWLHRQGKSCDCEKVPDTEAVQSSRHQLSR